MTLFKEKYESIAIDLKNVRLQANLVIPENNLGIIIFSHGSGSSRNSPRNKYVASILQQHGLATLLFDLLTEEEDQVYETRFNIDLLTKRLIEVTRWIQTDPRTKDLKIGYFGASTGAASALRAAGVLGDKLSAVVSRGGRPDLAMQELHKVKAPTLFLVGGWDDFVIDLNKLAYSKLECERELVIVPEASHLFEEPGKLEKVAHLSAKWFIKWFKT